jgi:hypothetical protein
VALFVDDLTPRNIFIKGKSDVFKKIELDISTDTTGPTLFNAVIEKNRKKILRGLKNLQN